MNVDDIKNVAVVGAGLMGHGIAQEFALGGYDVRINDITEEKLQKAVENIRFNLRMLTDIGTVSGDQAASTLSHISSSVSLEETVEGADVVIEAVLENQELKQDIFSQLDRLSPGHTIFASNSSTLMPSRLASATRRPGKVLVTHYFNPAYLMPLVEIVRHESTSDETVSVMYDLMKKIGKSPAIVQKEVPGFIGNRLQLALFREALSLVEQGVASPEDVDTVVKNGFGRRYAAAGPFEVWELAGWDLVLEIARYLLPDLASSTEISSLLKAKVAAGDLGVKAGKGFFDWTPDSAEALKRKIGKTLVELSQLSRAD